MASFTKTSRVDTASSAGQSRGLFEYVVADNLCIGCGTCSGVCPTGVWNLVANTPLE